MPQKKYKSSFNLIGDNKIKTKIFIRLFFVICITGNIIGAENDKSSLFPNQYFIGAAFSQNVRRGYFDMKGYRQEVDKEPLAFWGAAFARRYYLAPWLRLQFSTLLDFGSEITDTLTMYFPSENNIAEVAISNNFFHFSFGSELQYVFPPEKAFIPFLSMGIGLNYLSVREAGKRNDEIVGIREPVAIKDSEDKNFRINMQGGLGADIIITKKAKISLAYYYRYWHPMRYEYIRDLPLTTAEYWESYRSHGILIGIAWDEG
ncbi:MAG: hypothetical protein GF401_13050 [Chitinivibrionales bacterium]|nr:hypothetical protein [Chitinivibrionales bacterium]